MSLFKILTPEIVSLTVVVNIYLRVNDHFLNAMSGLRLALSVLLHISSKQPDEARTSMTW